jgi:sarcosine oxidase
MARTSSEVAVVGAGIVGLSVTHALRERGVDAVCFDGDEPGQAQSGGASRVFRHHIGTPALAALAVEARSAWDAWSERAGERLLLGDGWVRLGGDRAADLALLRGVGVPATELAPDQALARMPVIARPADPLLLDPLGGSTRTGETIAALVRWIGPALIRSRVHIIEREGASASLRTDAGTHTADVCVICAGAATDRLAREAGLPDVAQERRVHLRLTFRRRTGIGLPLPSWSDRSGIHGEVSYGLAPDGDTYSVGISALDAYPAPPPGADAVPPDTDVRQAQERIVAYVARAFPGLDPDPVDGVLRLTTTLPGREDDAFALWRDGPVAAFAGGNLFKFAPLLGPRIAAALLGGDGAEVFPGAAVSRA